MLATEWKLSDQGMTFNRSTTDYPEPIACARLLRKPRPEYGRCTAGAKGGQDVWP